MINLLTSSYTLGFALDNQIEEAWNQLGESTGDGQRDFFVVVFVTAMIIALIPMVFGCVAIVETLPCDFALLKETLAIMKSIENQRDTAPKSALVCHSKNIFP